VAGGRIQTATEATRIPPRRRRLIEQVARIAARRRLAPGGEVAAYYAGVDEEELARRPPLHWAAVLARHRQFGARRRAGETLVHVFNPGPRTDGFETPHTCVLVVTDDMPFLLDSLGMAFEAAAVGVHLIVHPVLLARRDASGRLRAWDGSQLAVPRVLEVSRSIRPMIPPVRRSSIGCVAPARCRAAVRDWMPMRQRMQAVAATLRVPRGAVRNELPRRALLEWMESGQFVFLGYRHYRLLRRVRCAPIGSGLGILRASAAHTAAAPYRLTGAVRKLARAPHPLVLTKATAVSTVHRTASICRG
jgi:glutamate dehydrogenase